MQIQLATLTQKGQVTIPVELRNFLGVKPYQKIAFSKGTDYLKVKSAGPSIFDLAGKYKIPKGAPGILEVRKLMEKNYSRF